MQQLDLQTQAIQRQEAELQEQRQEPQAECKINASCKPAEGEEGVQQEVAHLGQQRYKPVKQLQACSLSASCSCHTTALQYRRQQQAQMHQADPPHLKAPVLPALWQPSDPVAGMQLACSQILI